MGLSIHYSGRIKDAVSLPSLVDEVKEVCLVYGWKYIVKEDSFPGGILDREEFPEPIYGICFTPPGCETIDLTFLSNGVMVCPARMILFGNSQNKATKNFIYRISVKTQFAGMMIHAIIINLFKYLSSKYLANFEMIDEGLYWESGDENLLNEKFEAYNTLLDNFNLSMETFPIEEGEDMASYFQRLMTYINRINK